jgi:hypothetical protein
MSETGTKEATAIGIREKNKEEHKSSSSAENSSSKYQPSSYGPGRSKTDADPNQHQHGQFLRWAAGKGGGDDDSLHYLSEPSASEACDSTPDRQSSRSILSTMSGEDDSPPPPPRGPPPPWNSSHGGGSTGMASPGNTSLSSRESHFRPQYPNHRVRIHFSPEPASERNQYSHYSPYSHHQQYYYSGGINHPQAHQPFPQGYSQHAESPDRAILAHNTQEAQQQGNDPNNLDNSTAPRQSPAQASDNPFHDPTSEDNPNNLSYSTFSYSTLSSVSTKNRKQLDEFVDDLRQSSEGALQESPGSQSLLNTSTEDSTSQPRKNATVDTVLRSTVDNHKSVIQEKDTTEGARHHRISSVDTELIGNTSDVQWEEMDDKHEDNQQSPSDIRFNNADAALLDFSNSEDEDKKQSDDEQKSDLTNGKKIVTTEAGGQLGSGQFLGESGKDIGSGTNNSGGALNAGSSHTNATTTDDEDALRPDWDNQQHSADDEQTAIRPPRKRVFKVAGGKPSTAHRRTRSGDGVAAALATGGKDWRGMDKDKIPLPSCDDDDDEDDDDNEIEHPSRNVKNQRSEADQDNKSKGRNGSFPSKKRQQTGNETALFSVGASDAVTASRTAARRQRREQRQQQRLLAEKAAAAATQRRIYQQYHEWSNSPLWGVQRQNQHREGVGSSETPLGSSIPSAIADSEPLDGEMYRRLGENSSEEELNTDEEVPHPRNSIDTLASTISSSTGGGFGGRNRRHSVESRDSFFSWISTSNHGHDRDFTSSPMQAHSLRVHPHWSPEMAAESGWQQQRHQRTRTSLGGYVPYESLHWAQAAEQQQQENPFRRYLLQQQHQLPSHGSFQHYAQQTSPTRRSFGAPPGLQPPPPPPSTSTAFPEAFHSLGVGSQHDQPLRRSSQSSHNDSSQTTSGSGATSSEEEYDGFDDEFMNVHQNQIHQMHPNAGFDSLDAVEEAVEAELLKPGSYQHVLRGAPRTSSSPLFAFGRKQVGEEEIPKKKFDRLSFLPKTSLILENEDINYPTYCCPRCQTVQREFFTVADAPRQYETASGYLALYFTIYVIASLYIFGMEVGFFVQQFYLLSCRAQYIQPCIFLLLGGLARPGLYLLRW